MRALANFAKVSSRSLHSEISHFLKANRANKVSHTTLWSPEELRGVVSPISASNQNIKMERER